MDERQHESLQGREGWMEVAAGERAEQVAVSRDEVPLGPDHDIEGHLVKKEVVCWHWRGGEARCVFAGMEVREVSSHGFVNHWQEVPEMRYT